MSEFQKYIVEKLTQHALSVEEAATLFDVSIPSVQRWLNGDTIPATPMQNIIYMELTKLDRKKKD